MNTQRINKKKHKSKKLKRIIIFFSFVFILGFLGGNITHKVYSLFKVTSHPKNTSSNTNSSLELSSKGKESKTSSNGQASSFKKSEEILLSSVGDCTLGRDDKYSYEGSLPHVLKQHNNDYSYVFKNVNSIFKNDDITIANFEGTLTTSNAKAVKRFTFKAPMEYAKILTSANIEGVNLSNNHIKDYLEQGFEDTKIALKKENINFFGEDNIWIKEIRGIKFGFLGYKGFSDTPDLLEKIKNDIDKLKKQNCIVIINFHWGNEGNYTPNTTQQNIAHYSIDNGADLIIGHHPHVLQGIEKYNNKLIFYSMGNFAFGGNKNPRDKDSIITQIKFKISDSTLKSYDFKIIPCKISSVNYKNDYCPTPAQGNEKSNILNKINNLSKKLNLDINIDGNFNTVSME
ncbi:CapA family protein [Clostridium botulinum]|uniref:Capsule biosynthesis protein CapA n=2 Tax=Clostridium botulinum TaxID=1491 RepID=A0A9Q1UZT8_CLOBO|nr:CapA family protein [Clostridium botulinum]AEB75434.1 capsule synthesis protein, CapA [Clostridium botulinum BKT015925]KEI00778.1 capsule biosynthesis protein CapA [Clostridium botulinum C/D str. Sp77]KOA73173.1 capsule biosynthesis protein CapA [Clostridium botulinum]KOA79699.1 capsule biosynthesis protein CapA [Clostridium botulinum]KOA85984.1 capsule biosynthesis protein CapA [Clostridium botulinum]